MLPNHLKRNESEIAAIKELIARGADGPVLMLNLNTYTPAAGYPNGELYRRYVAGLEAIVKSLGGKFLWRRPVYGQPVGEQKRVDEIIAVWYPTHQAYLDVATAPGGDENYRLRALCVERAVIHRCPGDSNMLSP
jgi:hypothetical protein